MENYNEYKRFFIGLGVILGLLILLTLAPFKIIQTGKRGVILRLGRLDRILNEGINWKLPLIEKAYVLDVKIQKIQVEASSASKDLQTVHTQIALNFHLTPEKVDQLFQKIGKDYQLRVIDPAIQESVKSATAKFTAEELITKRESVKESIKDELKTRLIENFISVDELNIVDFNFSEQFNSAIEAKVTAEQNAFAAKNKLEQVKFEAEQRVAQAKAEAEAIRIQAQAITQQGGKEYVNLKAVEKWDGRLPTQMIPNATLPFINLNK